jgi:hypothetical protein
MIKINLEVDEVIKEYELPSQWSEVKVKHFSKIYNVDTENLTIIEQLVKTINIFCEIDEEDLYQMTPQDFNKISEQLKFLNSEVETEQVEYLECIDGEKYWLKKDFDNLTMGEIISIDTIMSQCDNNLSKALDKLLCIFLRKKKENGNLETFKNSFMGRIDVFNELPISKVYNLFIFFLNGGISSEINIPQSSENQE